jgi:HD-like signal output (HDOD) protein
MGQICRKCQTEFELRAVSGGGTAVSFCPGCGAPWDGAAAEDKAPDVETDEAPRPLAANPLLGFLENQAGKADMKLPVLPEVGSEVLHMARDPEVDIQKLAGFIGRDQVIAGKVLKLANSALYRGFTEVTTIAQAIPRIGLNTLGANVLTIATEEVYSLDEPILKKVLASLWDHALAVATASHSIAKAIRYHDVDKAFIAGLLHDVGKVVILHLLKENRELVRQIVESEDLMQEAFDAYNRRIGGELLQRWNLAADLIEAVGAVEDPRRANRARTLAAIVHVADLIANHLGIGWRADPSVDPMGSEWPAALGLDPVRVAAIEVEIEDMVGEMKKAL